MRFIALLGGPLPMLPPAMRKVNKVIYNVTL